MTKYIIFKDTKYYPYVVGIFKKEEEAIERFEEEKRNVDGYGETLYLCKIIKEEKPDEI